MVKSSKIPTPPLLVEEQELCYHCGQQCDEIFWSENKPFCCQGCKGVFEILQENNLGAYYAYDKGPGISLQSNCEESYAYLNEVGFRKKMLEFDSPRFARMRLTIPAIHCISCVWLLENLHRIEHGVKRSEVNFTGRKVCIDFDPEQLSPGRLASRLASLGYAPQLSHNPEKLQEPSLNRSLITKLAVSGFAFGNVMLLSFPEYLGLDPADGSLTALFSTLNVFLSVPVMVYAASDYFLNAWKSFEQKQINIDVPIALGLLALFSRSIYDILNQSGPGYLDSLTGLVFFLLVGRWFQGMTYDALAFDRDYKSYFPLAIQKKIGDEWTPVSIHELKPSDCIRVRNLEVVPADSHLLSPAALIDYSFVTGESRPTKVEFGSLVFAGGRLVGQPVELTVARPTSEGSLTSLWNNPIFQKREERGYRRTIDVTAKRFTWAVMILALATAVIWYFYDPSRVWLVFTSVLMVACPCALALAAPFTYGTALRILGKNQMYLKNADVIERMGAVGAVVFDKTGTVTHNGKSQIEFVGDLSSVELSIVKTLTACSTHPLSGLITRSINSQALGTVEEFKEHPGYGMEAIMDGHHVKIGSAHFVGLNGRTEANSTKVFVSIDALVRGYFSIHVAVRKNFGQMVRRLGRKCAALISGDDESDRLRMSELFAQSTQLVFNQRAIDKLRYIKDLQQNGNTVMMVGDGLNDAGALKQSDVGIAVTDDTSVFSPACDGILHGDKLILLDRFLDFAKASTGILKTAFAISFGYNAIALSIAATGHLTPIVAAVLMPISSISVVIFASVAVNYSAKRKLILPP